MRLLPATEDDLPFLWEMLAQAALPGGGELPPGLMADDHIRRYLDGWGRAGDRGLVAWIDGRPVGAVWTRLLPPDRPGYGFVDATTPELSIAVVEGVRGRGVGRALVTGALDVAAAHGHPQVSLSVALTNTRAVDLYRSLGFVDVAPDDGGSITMLASSAPVPPADDGPIVARLADAEDGPALARLRREMIAGMGVADEGDWVAPFLALWPEEQAAGRWRGTLVPGPDGRAVSTSIAAVSSAPPGPGRPDGVVAHIGSVSTEPAWRRRGCARAALSALLDALDHGGVGASMLNASADGADLYRSFGFTPSVGQAMHRPRP